MLSGKFGALPTLRLFAMPLLRHPKRTLLCMLAIALGVALGVAVSSIHRSAIDEFSHGLRVVAGSADAQVIGPLEGFDESIYGRIARRPDVEWASPIVEVQARLADREASVQLIGLDPLRAWRVQASLLPPTDRLRTPREFGLLAEDTVALSPAAAQALGAGIGDRVRFISGTEIVELSVIALLPAIERGQQLAVADIATVQTRFKFLGRISRLDLILARDRSAAEVRAAIGETLPPGLAISLPRQAEARSSQLSRAYRVNLTMLALIALLAGSFLVFSTQAVSIVRRRSELAFLRALGLTRREIVRGLLTEAAVIGLLGSLLGVALGLGLAMVALRVVGGDLGGGFFSGSEPSLVVAPLELASFLLLGSVAAVAGAWLPAHEAASVPPALALRAGDQENALAKLNHPAPGLALLGLGVLALAVPPVAQLPLGAYAAIGLWLAGSVLLLPQVSRILFSAALLHRLAARGGPIQRLALSQLRGASGMASIGTAGVLAATAVAAAMAIMVLSFRHSVDQWLDSILPSDLYVQASSSTESGFLDQAAQRVLSRVEGVEKVDFIRRSNLIMAPDSPPVALIARPLTGPPPAVSGERLNTAARDIPLVWGSEAMADLYGWRVGQRVNLPIGGQHRTFVIGGFWRDYMRSYGAVVVDLALYQKLTGDGRVSSAGLSLAPGARAADLLERLRASPATAMLDIVDASEIRARSLQLFDRTFAVTYALEGAAVLIGLAGVAASFAALAAGRLREFGMLAHLGLTRRDLFHLMACEGAATAGLGIGLGMVLAFAIAFVLIEFVNRQSFHWSMDFHVPWLALTVFGAVMMGCATFAALVAARPAIGRRAVLAVREDW